MIHEFLYWKNRYELEEDIEVFDELEDERFETLLSNTPLLFYMTRRYDLLERYVLQISEILMSPVCDSQEYCDGRCQLSYLYTGELEDILNDEHLMNIISSSDIEFGYTGCTMMLSLLLGTTNIGEYSNEHKLCDAIALALSEMFTISIDYFGIENEIDVDYINGWTVILDIESYENREKDFSDLSEWIQNHNGMSYGAIKKSVLSNKDIVKDRLSMWLRRWVFLKDLKASRVADDIIKNTF